VLARAYLWSIGLVVLVTAGIWLAQHIFKVSLLSISPIYLVAVLFCAITLGRWPAMLCAGLSFVAFKFFFVAPIYSFTVDDAEDVSRLLVFLATAFLVGGMAIRVREQATAAQRRAAEVAALYDLSQAISAELSFEAIAPRCVSTTMRLLQSPGCRLLLAAPAGVSSVAAQSGSWPADAAVVSAPLRSGEQSLGALQVVRPAEPQPWAEEQQRLLETLASQASLALERSRLAQAAAQAEALVASDRLKSTLLSAISHDVRTPLASITAAADELRARDVAWSPAAIQELADLIGAQAQRLNHLVTNLLDLTRIEAGVLSPQRGWYSIAEILYAVLQRLAGDLADRPLELIIADDLPLLPIDYVQIEQVLWNILENARKYSPPGTPITIAVAAREQVLQIQIGDRGPGIPADERVRVFEKFYRLPQQNGERVPGSGIGLAICKGLVEAHGGQITILGREGGGTLVEIGLPLSYAAAPLIVGA
jgi:two-component system sensor histidine kinase KdpD